jgi:predicted NBD/HSP70 family sugar kinase
VALGPYLKKKFSMPVYINNDGDLYAYGEALGGLLPEVNEMLDDYGNRKRYRNLVGFTLGTGLGIGVVANGELNRGDNSCIEMFSIPLKGRPDVIAEEGISIRAVKRMYGELSGNPDHGLSPKDIFEIAEGVKEGDMEAAKGAFAQLGAALGDVIAMTVSIIDGLVVIGGGLSGAYKYIKDSMFESIRGKMKRLNGEEISKLASKVYDLDDKEELRQFLKGEQRQLKIYNSEIEVTYDPQKRIGVALSKIGANKAVSLGAYAFALHQLSR